MKLPEKKPKKTDEPKKTPASTPKPEPEPAPPTPRTAMPGNGEHKLDEQVEESFPASDPPSFTPSHSG